MRLTRTLIITGFGAFALATGCATSMNRELTNAEVEYRSAAADPTVSTRAKVPLYEAKKELDLAKQAFDDGEDKYVVDHHAYLAQRKVEIARATAQKEVAEKQVETLGKQRDAAVLDARTREADTQRQRAQVAEITAESLRSELADLKAKDTERGLVITLNTDVLFDTDRSELKPGAMAELQRLAEILNREPARRVRIEGHADSTGTEAHNLDLSLRRADAVANALVGYGVARSRVVTQGFGASMPVAGNDTAAGRQQNRRVEVVVMDQGS